MTSGDAEQIHRAVRDRYADAAHAAQAGTCCGQEEHGVITSTLYERDETDFLPADAVTASLGCGNPTMLADLKLGEIVLDLGSGGGIDVLLSARRVGPDGIAYGLDMTPEMLALARKNQAESGLSNVEFLEGTIEDIPLSDKTVDVVISNCVVNLSPDKNAVLREAFRVLKPGGRLAISDIVLRRGLSETTRALIGLWTGCVAGALLAEDYLDKLRAAGFEDVTVEPTRVFESTDVESLAVELSIESEFPEGIDRRAILDELGGTVMSTFVRGCKPE
jgi:ubiquinone/menaquinone biosynthesis C-methylase UbiE